MLLKVRIRMRLSFSHDASQRLESWSPLESNQDNLSWTTSRHSRSLFFFPSFYLLFLSLSLFLRYFCPGEVCFSSSFSWSFQDWAFILWEKTAFFKKSPFFEGKILSSVWAPWSQMHLILNTSDSKYICLHSPWGLFLNIFLPCLWVIHSFHHSSFKMRWFIFFFLLVPLVSGLQLFPIGENSLPEGDEISSPPIPLSVPIVFYGTSYEAIFVREFDTSLSLTLLFLSLCVCHFSLFVTVISLHLTLVWTSFGLKESRPP